MLTNWAVSEDTLIQVASVFSIIFFVVGVCSTILNGILVLITIRYRKLHNVSNILIACQAAVDAVLTWNNPIFLYNTYARRFIPVSTCFKFQVLPMSALNFTAFTMLLIGIDRYLSAKYSLWHMTLGKKLYFLVLITCNMIFVGIFAVAFYFSASNEKVLCFGTDTMAGVVKEVWGGVQGVINVAVLVVYTKVKAVLKHQIDNENKEGRKIFTSLYLIMVFYICSWLTAVVIFMSARVLTNDPNLTETIDIFLGSFVCINLFVPFCVYYKRSQLYRRQIRRLFGLTAKVYVPTREVTK